MSLRKYGIYLAYAPTVDLKNQGLGRHLVEFLKGAQQREDVRFVIACPSWMKENLVELFDSSGVRLNSFEIISPTQKPLLLSLHQRYLTFRTRAKKPRRWADFLSKLNKNASNLIFYVERRLVISRSVFQLAALGFVTLPFLVIGILGWLLLSIPIALLQFFVQKFKSLIRHIPILQRCQTGVSILINNPKKADIVARLYRVMEESESVLMNAIINARNDVKAWYSPAAFWPHFNEINAPRLMCVPDVVLVEFPLGFAAVGGDRFLENFRQVEKAIEEGEYFVTYSQDVKWNTLVGRYQIEPDAIAVIPHGANRLDDLVVVSGFPDNDEATNSLCRNLFRGALHKAVNNRYASIFDSNDIRYIFYASQFRPNKNILSLLKAYEYLLKRQYIGYKLVLTGNPNVSPDILAFINEHFLENDVLFLHGLTTQELAATYRLADLAVNPSLSEGGCPFTFTEAMSVGTPAVMARIAVTEEIISDPVLQEHMLFDPYDWEDMAKRVEWALQNQTELLEMQRPLYDQLVHRTWQTVVNEYVDILDRISSTSKMA